MDEQVGLKAVEEEEEEEVRGAGCFSRRRAFGCREGSKLWRGVEERGGDGSATGRRIAIRSEEGFVVEMLFTANGFRLPDWGSGSVKGGSGDKVALAEGWEWVRGGISRSNGGIENMDGADRSGLGRRLRIARG